MSWKLAH